ncbi:phage major capsid protein, P2 family [Candidatus Arsenophonus triatominarum]|uniref:phage major capsid protein, P2 family n=1 Tax=Candidatus Arsenophonus triatominarum TaxID=57911 RepID=UPI0007C4C783|nr:phage major capsid protein, P2 family [Candidatus Arsenophonus triatominarum]
MRKETKFKFDQYLSRLGEIYHVSPQDFAGKVNIEPSKVQVLESQIQQSAGFLQKINLVPVVEQQGQVIGLGIGSTVAGTTDTSSKSRETIDPTALNAIDYYCYQTNFDTAISYAKLDVWAKFNDFQRCIRDAIVRRQALDRIMIGFNGIKREKTSDLIQNAKLQDVNIGWLQKIRNDAPPHVMANITDSQGKVASNTIRIGEKGDYKNLDALVMDTVERVIDEVYQDDTDLVIICGRSLLADKYFPIVNKEQANSEMLAADVIVSQKRLGGLPAIRAPFFPDKSLLITRLDNLSIYYQQDTRRQQIKDTPERDRIENYELVNEAYVVEDYRGVALVENIEILPEEKAQTAVAGGNGQSGQAGSGQANQGGG